MDVLDYTRQVRHWSGGFLSREHFNTAWVQDQEANDWDGIGVLEVVDSTELEDEGEKIITLFVSIDEPSGETRRRWVLAVRGFSGATVIMSGPISSTTPVNELPEVQVDP